MGLVADGTRARVPRPPWGALSSAHARSCCPRRPSLRRCRAVARLAWRSSCRVRQGAGRLADRPRGAGESPHRVRGRGARCGRRTALGGSTGPVQGSARVTGRKEWPWSGAFSNGSEAHHFAPGRRVVVYATDHHGAWSTVCNRTRAFAPRQLTALADEVLQLESCGASAK